MLPPLGVTDRQHQGRAANLPGGRDHVGLWRERTNFSRRARPRERQLSRLCRGPKNANKRPNRDRPNPDHRTLLESGSKLSTNPESVHLRTRAFKAKMEYSGSSFHFLSLQRLQHKELLTPPEVRRAPPAHMQHKKFFMLPYCKREKPQNVFRN